jgi:DNA-binding transcriptional LysR family regulator
MRQNLNKLSIMMLTALEALYIARKTTVAAERLGVAQPSMSVYLKQLRELTGDELFVRGAHGLEPTDFCHAYYESVKGILDSLGVLAAQRNAVFDPQTMSASFAVSIPFVRGRVLFEELSVRLGRKFPRVKVDMVSLPEKEALRYIEEGTTDLCIGLVSEKLEKHFPAAKLFKTDLVVICSDKSPLFKKTRITKAEYLETPHIKATASFEPSMLDAKFRQMGMLQKTLVCVPNIGAEIALLRETDYLLIMDRSDVEFIREGNNIKILKTDFDIPQFDFYAVWHARKNNDPAHKWYRDYVFDICRGPEKRGRSDIAIKPKTG